MDFDTFSEGYESALERGLAVSGETQDYFAKGRVEWTKRVLARECATPRRILDFGCGTGSTAPLLFNAWPVQSLIGVDTSRESVRIARSQSAGPAISFDCVDDYAPSGDRDLVYCNGVFHHIEPAGRAAVVKFIHASLAPGGILAFFENNPWNPGTRVVMSRIPFDADASTLSILNARRLLRAGAFEIVRSDFLFVFPRQLAWLRPAEPLLSRLPIGAQYLVLARKVKAS